MTGGGAAGGPPEHLRILLEGESLLNDACSITLFTIFIHFVTSAARGHPSTEPIPEVIAIVLKQTAWLTLGVLADPPAVQLFPFITRISRNNELIKGRPTNGRRTWQHIKDSQQIRMLIMQKTNEGRQQNISPPGNPTRNHVSSTSLACSQNTSSCFNKTGVPLPRLGHLCLRSHFTGYSLVTSIEQELMSAAAADQALHPAAA